MATKKCTKCGEVKERTEFNRRSVERKKRDPWCKACRRIHHLWLKHGLTPDDYDRMFAEQKGCCAICKRHQSMFTRRLVVDHNHLTGEVRELLCDSCNLKLGGVMHEQFIEKAAVYLQRHKK